jgi:hypothetical protein
VSIAENSTDNTAVSLIAALNWSGSGYLAASRSQSRPAMAENQG